ncbi:MAG TPA: putative transporter [Planctomycetes bacterium]|nr:putative transporter [Planctomycetota bacterium]
MNWPDLLWTMWLEIVTGATPAGWIVALGVTIAAGVALGHIKVFGVSLGVTTVIFAAIAYSWALWSPNGMAHHALVETKVQIEMARLQAAPPPAAQTAPDGTVVTPPPPDEAAVRAKVEKSVEDKVHVRKEVLEFIREFGLVLFVYCIGMMVGPGFLQSLRNQGVRWNIMAGSVVLLGLGVTALVVVIAGQHPTAAVGVMSGAITNTPGWAAAQATLKELKAPAEQIGMTVSGYAVAYPFGIAGIIGSLITLRMLFGIRPKDEVEAFAKANQAAAGAANINLKVSNPGIIGKSVAHVDALAGDGVVVSRVQRGDEQLVPKPDFSLALGDLLHAVGGKEGLARLQEIVGERIDDDIREAQVCHRLLTREVVVTNQHVVGDGIAKLDFPRTCGATVTRIKRHGKELLADDDADLHFADRLVVVGDEMGIKRVEERVGNSSAGLDHPQLIGLFLGIAVGIVLGQIPIPIPGLSQPVKLGLAGGPIVAALVFSSMGHLGKHIIFHVAKGANNLMREFGIALFLACVGLLSAQSFVTYAFSMQGLLWIVCALCIAMIPLLIVGIVARVFFKENYTALMGVLAGSCTDPPALAFANGTAGNELPGLAYATVYPLTMLMRVVGAQIFVLLWMAT